jgi:dUTPase
MLRRRCRCSPSEPWKRWDRDTTELIHRIRSEGPAEAWLPESERRTRGARGRPRGRFAGTVVSWQDSVHAHRDHTPRPGAAVPRAAALARCRTRPPRARGRPARPGGRRALVPTGVTVTMPAGHAGPILRRSGLALRHGVTCLKRARSYRPALSRRTQGAASEYRPTDPYNVQPGDRIAQLVVVPHEEVEWCEVAALCRTPRDTFGFGSTGA